MVEEPSYVKQLSLNHVCKMGVNVSNILALFLITSMPCDIVSCGYRCGIGKGRIGTLKKISVMHVIKLGFAPVSFPPG